ncbi:WD40/YVTN repeat-like protein [Schizosaccharomyces japonicus yFS275]|uniref:WD40/YVTN repeat-like protein n=1 Tax=Schizosaccharomyces japonicus (strain yFS275 / FY16936) TaxID=402676 RepID=B6JVY5_SCHJY|nr:WD40/YVTN repeat-like protein [Schizosaccharomyces japonicus yFS275]EEB05536.1 WD40/YVTN repeat-like protein [Schizosaccharomyces japonicus yFS275]
MSEISEDDHSSFEQYSELKYCETVQDYFADFIYSDLFEGNDACLEKNVLDYPTSSNFWLPSNKSDCVEGPLNGITDSQGIPWGSIALGERFAFREYRLSNYVTTCNSTEWYPSLFPVQSTDSLPSELYEFSRFDRRINCFRVHFQLSYNLAAISKKVLYSVENGISIYDFHSQTHKLLVDLNPFLIQDNYACCLAASDTLGACGTLQGGLLFSFNTENGTQEHVSLGETSVNHVSLLCDSSSSRILASTNDQTIKLFDPCESLRCIQTLNLPWAVNCANINPSGKLILACGDSPYAQLHDPRSRKRVARLSHMDYSVCCAWHPNGNHFATSSQDTSTRIWDARKLGNPVQVLSSKMSAVHNLQFSGDGRILAAAEKADFVQLFKTRDYSTAQTLDFFGEISGISFSPDDDAFYIGIDDPVVGGLLEYRVTLPSIGNLIL